MAKQAIQKPEVGQSVRVRWTNCGHQYSVPGKVVRVNAKSVRVSIDSPVMYPEGHEFEGRACYEAGREIVVPVWPYSTQGNGVFEEEPIKTRSFPDLTGEDWEEIEEGLQLDDELLDKIKAVGEGDPELNDVEWLMIYQGLTDKLAGLRSGFYDRDRIAKDWQAHVEEMLAKLDAISAEYIGGAK